MKEHVGLLAKISRPKITNMLPRARLFKLLDRAREKPVTWISGPGGSGKTTLVSTWLDARKLPYLWYQVDAGDADPATFFYYLGLAAKKAAPGKKKPLPLLTPEYFPNLSVFTRRYFEDLAGRLKKPFIIVFDNYQDVPVDSPFHDIISAGIAAIPDGIRVIILSRVDSPQQFARLRANSGLCLLGWDEMRFTADELRDMVRQSGQKKLNTDALDYLHRTTEGWVAGIVLMLERIRQNVITPENLSAIKQEGVFDYFAHELFNKATPDIRDFLMKTAFLPQITPDMAETLTGSSNAKAILSRLANERLFTTKLDQQEATYQYHQLLRAFLLAQARGAFNDKEQALLRRSAATLSEKEGWTEFAVELLAEASDWQEYTRLVLTHAQALAGQGRFATLKAWIERIPKPVCESQPWFLFWLGVCKKPVSPPQGRTLFERALDLFQTQGDVVGLLLAWAEIIDTFLYEWNDFHPLDRWITWLDSRMQADPSFPSPEIEARVASCMVNALVFRRPDHPEIAKWLERALNFTENVADAGLRMHAYVHLGNYYLWMGDNANGFWVIERIKHITKAPAATPFMTIISNWIEAVTYGVASTDFEASLRLIAEGLETANKTGIHIWDNFLFGFGAYSALCKGDLAFAGEYLEKMETTLASRFQNVVLQNHLSALRFNLLGDVDRAVVSGEKAVAAATESGMMFNIALSNISMAHIYHASGDHQKAADLLAITRQSIRNWRSLILEYMCLIAEAHFSLNLGVTKEGIEVLRKAMALGRSQGYMGFIFWWDPKVMAELCAKALEAGIEVDYVRTLIRKRNLPPPDTNAESNTQSATQNLTLESWPWLVKIYTLGRFELFIDDKPLMFPGKIQQKPLAMLKALVAFGGKDVSEEQLTDALWPDSDGDVAHKSFDTTLHRLRKLINHDKAIVLREGQVSLDARYCCVDMWAFEKIIAECGMRIAEGRTKTGIAESASAQFETILLEKAVNLYKGHFLPGDAKQPWSISLRERLRAQFTQSVNTLGGIRIEAGRYDKAAMVFMKGLEIDDLAEEFYQHLMACYHQMGQQTEAIKTYHRCCGVLQSSLGLKPSSKTEGVYYAIRQAR